MKTSIAVASVIVSIAATYFWTQTPKAASKPAATPQNSQEEEPARRDQPDLRDTERRIANLNAELAQLRARVNQLPSAVPSAASDAAEPPLTPQEHEQRRNDYLDRLQTNFEVEVRDPRWAAKTSESLQNAAQQTSIQGALRNVECHSESCRVELVAKPGDVEFDKQLPVFLHTMQELPSTRVRTEVQADGQRVLTLYMRKTNTDATSSVRGPSGSN